MDQNIRINISLINFTGHLAKTKDSNIPITSSLTIQYFTIGSFIMDAFKFVNVLKIMVEYMPLAIIYSRDIFLMDFESANYLLIQVKYQLDFPIDLLYLKNRLQQED